MDRDVLQHLVGGGAREARAREEVARRNREEAAEIGRSFADAIRDVDEVVAITDDPSRLLEWDRRPFDCFFSGDDYSGNAYWEWEREELRKRGSDIVFFPYTKEQSTTKIRKKLGE